MGTLSTQAEMIKALIKDLLGHLYKICDLSLKFSFLIYYSLMSDKTIALS